VSGAVSAGEVPDSENAAPGYPPMLPRSLDYPDRPVGFILAAAARRWGDRPAFIHRGQQRTWTEVWHDACRFAHGLASLGVQPGDVVVLHLPNCLQYPVAYWGLLLTGATFSPANPLLPSDNLRFQVTDCGARTVITFGPVAPALAACEVPLSTVVVVGPLDPAVQEQLAGCAEQVLGFDQVLAGQPATPPETVVDTAGLAHLAYTGGTTGWSKGVRLPHRNVVTNALQFACWGNGAVPAVDESGDVILDQIGSAEEWPTRLGEALLVNLTPWFHAMGTVGYLNIPALTGATLVLHDRFDPGEYLADVERYRATSMGGAPPIFVALLRHPDFATRDLSSVRAIASGAAALPVEVIEGLKLRLPGAVVGEGYGLTEATMGAVSNPSHRSGVRKPGSVGIPVFDTEVRIVPFDADSPDASCLTGEEGEVCLRGPQTMLGYHNRPEETAAALVDGWLHTGDIGVLDDDGYLRIVDRKKDMLIYKGYNVYPRELEELLFTHPDVANAAVVGRPDLEAGDMPVAFVVLRAGASATVEDLMAHVNEKVTPYKKLREVKLIDAIPVSAAGKVLKRELRVGLVDQS
jgi:long-chain acyl-CoA synthetase